MAKGEQTRARILDIAEAAVLSKGFGATSIDEIITEADLTKSGFLYHFRDKNALALALLQRYVEQDDALMDETIARARALTDDPLQTMLVTLKLFAEIFDDLPNGHPGCMVAAVCYAERSFHNDVRLTNRDAVLSWRARFKEMFDDIVAIYPPNDDVSTEALADMFSVIVDGGIIVQKSLNDPKMVGRQMELYRSYVKLLFTSSRQ